MPKDFLEVALVSALLGLLFGTQFKNTIDARRFAVYSFIFGTLSWAAKSFIMRDLNANLWERLFSWDISLFFVIYGSTARKGVKKFIETHWPELMLKIPILKLL